MQISQLVTVRRQRWRIADIRPYEDCQLITLTGIEASDAGIERQVLTPFDTVEPIERPSSLRRVRATVWRHAARALLASDVPPGGLRTVHQAGIEVMPHQLEPALAVLRGLGCRVLLADEVGLGKTIQAAIVIAELRARGAADRVLVLTPAGLREQWTQELSARFGIEAQVADAMTMRRRATEMPVGLNPWSIERVAVASIDYVKRPEVLPAVAADPWDVVVVDEAHAAAGDSDRRAAVGALASRAAFVLLLTATPHSGDRQSFVSLTRIGALDARNSLEPAAPDNLPLLVFRRKRSDVRAGARRRVHVLRVTPTAAATEMHALLTTYTKALLMEHEGAWLPASVLHKRAFSSAWSLAQSVERRLETLTRAEARHSAGDGEQLALPLGDPDGEQTKADEPPSWPPDLSLADPLRETRLLRELLAAAQLASRAESKLDAIRRILRRASQPAIVFTEYRDTLKHLRHVLRRPAAVLHGGLTRDERAAALHDFSSGRQTLLLATDAAGEGLNLHHACRIVINLELPWNPMRLEQRIGRVDRIGQQRVVHAWHLVANAVGEVEILDRLKTRIERARADLGAPDPFGDDEERAIARAVVSGLGAENGQPPPAYGEFFDPLAVNSPKSERITAPDLRGEAAGEARRLAFSRSLTETRRRREAPALLTHPARAVASPEADGVWACRARGSATRAALGQRILLLYRLAFEDGCGRIVESSCVGVVVRFASEDGVLVQCGRDSASSACLRHLLASIEPDVCRLIETATAPWRAAVERITGAFTSTRLRRERAIEAALETTAADAFQPGLFDRRAERRHFDAIVDRRRFEHELASRVDRIVAASALRSAPTVSASSPPAAAPRPLLVLVP